MCTAECISMVLTPLTATVVNSHRNTKGKCKQLPQPASFPAVKAHGVLSVAQGACGTICRPSSVLSLQPFSDLSVHAMVLIASVRH